MLFSPGPPSKSQSRARHCVRAVSEQCKRVTDYAELRPQNSKSAILNTEIPGGKVLRMSKLETIEMEVRKLPLAQAVALQDWLADYLEDSAELNPEFVASIERGNADIREDRVRVHRPDNDKG